MLQGVFPLATGLKGCHLCSAPIPPSLNVDGLRPEDQFHSHSWQFT